MAGKADTVKAFCDNFEEEMSQIGLSINPAKSEVILAGGSSCTVPQTLFSGFQWRLDGNFRLLGAPFGDAAYCSEHTTRRKIKAEKLLQEISSFGHTQGALLMLRQCGSWCKLVYSARTVPPDLHRDALRSFSTQVRCTLE